MIARCRETHYKLKLLSAKDWLRFRFRKWLTPYVVAVSVNVVLIEGPLIVRSI